MAQKPSDFFREIADKIDRNAEEDFAGAFLVVPPSINNVPSETISAILVGKPDSSMFFGVVTSKISITLKELEDKQKNGGWR